MLNIKDNTKAKYVPDERRIGTAPENSFMYFFYNVSDLNPFRT